MLDAFNLLQLIEIAAVGLVAGTLGGMLGVGGSVIMIPALIFILGKPTGVEQHLYQASAMIANIAVSVPAALRHHKAGAVMPAVLKWMLPAALVTVVLGVWLSNLPVFSGRDGGVWLGRVLACFLVYVIVVNLLKLRTPKMAAGQTSPPGESDADARSTAGRSLTVGTIMGTASGLLGIGGGGLAVPLQQTLMYLPLRRCIANSGVVICFSATLGAIYKCATLSNQPVPEGFEPITWVHGLTLGLILAPTGFLGGRIGAGLTHSLPLRTIRIVFICMIVVGAFKMADLPF